MLRWILAVVALCALAACTAPATSTTSTTEQAPPTSTPTSTLPPVVDCPGTGDFGEGGLIAQVGDETADASSLGQVTWQTSDRCEAFQFTFQTPQGAPATSAPVVSMSHMESFQVIRVSIDVRSASLVDQLVETDLVERIYAVRSIDGGMFVDFHLRAPAAARARVEGSPARLLIDLRPGLIPFTGESSVSDTVVVVSPPDEAEVDRFTQFIGYVRDPASELMLIVTQDGASISSTETTPVEGEGGWGEFRQSIGLPDGPAQVFVGDADNGSLEGVVVDVTAR